MRDSPAEGAVEAQLETEAGKTRTRWEAKRLSRDKIEELA